MSLHNCATIYGFETLSVLFTGQIPECMKQVQNWNSRTLTEYSKSAMQDDSWHESSCMTDLEYEFEFV